MIFNEACNVFRWCSACFSIMPLCYKLHQLALFQRKLPELLFLTRTFKIEIHIHCLYSDLLYTNPPSPNLWTFLLKHFGRPTYSFCIQITSFVFRSPVYKSPMPQFVYISPKTFREIHIQFLYSDHKYINLPVLEFLGIYRRICI